METEIKVKKSLSDKCEYKVVILSNNLRCLLVSDPLADKSSASCSVMVGALLDPKTHQGLAHFCEHMLFMGTEKYPNENDFAEFLNKNSGWSNAYTDLDHTNYYFESSNESFLDALDRFAQFFSKPLFLESSVEREMKAVDSEHKKNLQSDSWRDMQLQRSETDCNSIFNAFATGDIDTLNKPDTRDKLLEFHSKYYSARKMGLVVLTKMSLQDLEEKVTAMFSSVSDFEVNIPNFMSIEPYNKENVNLLYHVVPIKDNDELKITWYLKDYNNQYYKKDPLRYLSSVLGHEGPNSILSTLMKDDLGTALFSGYDIIASSFTSFYIIITLTKKGLNEWKEVLKRLIYQVRNIQSKPINKRVWDEIQEISQLTFDYKNKDSPSNYTKYLSNKLHKFEFADILTAGYTLEEYDEGLLRKTCDLLSCENIHIYLKSHSFREKCDKTEPIYGTSYCKEVISDEIRNMFYCKFEDLKVSNGHFIDYPPENTFIPKDFKIFDIQERNEYPTKILDDGRNVVWHKQDHTFLLPKAVVYVQVYFNSMEFLPFRDVDTISHIWSYIFENQLREIKYMADEAKVSFSISFNNEGLNLVITGFNSSIKPVLVELLTLFKKITAEGKESKLATQLENFNKSYRNYYLNNPYSLAFGNVDFLLREPSATPEEKLKVLSKIDMNYLRTYVDNYLNETRFEWLIQGNILQSQALEIAAFCHEIIQKDILPLHRTPCFRMANIPGRVNYVYQEKSKDPNNKNSCITSYFQIGGNLSIIEALRVSILTNIFTEPFFNELRTKQALGYIVQMFQNKSRKVTGIYFLVQSSVKSPEYIWARITEFISKGLERLNEMDDEKFLVHVDSVRTELKKKDLKLSDEAARNYWQIKNRDFTFDIREKQLNLINQITKQEIIDLYNEAMIKNFKRLDSQLIATCHEEDNEKHFIDNKEYATANDFKRVLSTEITDFKKRVPLFEDFMF